MEVKGKKVLVFGLGISGIGAGKILERQGAEVVLYDGNKKLMEEKVRQQSGADSNAKIIIGEFPEEILAELDMTVLSPGVPTDLPVIEKIKQEFSVPVSLDTYKAAVAKEGIQAGADLLNDIWGLQYDPVMGKIVADSGVAYCLMHNRDKITEEMDADLFIEQMKEDAKRALDAGIKKERIILDPGVGFAKTQEQNLMTIANLDRLKALGYPVLLGTSRKSVIGYVLDVPTDKRLVGTLATSAVAVQTGCMFVRVHDVKENVELIQMLERIRESR